MKPSTVRNLWSALLTERRKDFIGGEIEHIANPEGIFRGPITAISIEGNKLIVITDWTAHMPTDPSRHDMPLRSYWERVTRTNAEKFTYDLGEVKDFGLITGPPRNMGERVHFGAEAGFARVTLFPKGGDKLDRNKVRGL